MLEGLKGKIFLLFVPGREIVWILVIVKRSTEDTSKSLAHLGSAEAIFALFFSFFLVSNG
jgi:hypothetical protein